MNINAQHFGKFPISSLNVFFNAQNITLQVAQAGKTQFDFPFKVSGVINENAFPQVVVDAVSCCPHSLK